MDRDGNRAAQPNSRLCFVCGMENPVGLKLRFWDNGADEVQARYTVCSDYQGFPGIVHGGVVAAMLDETAGRTVMIDDPNCFMMTVKMTIKYRKPVPTETPLLLLGRLLKRRGRLAIASSEIRLPDDSLAAEAEVTLAALPEEYLEDMDVEEAGWQVWPTPDDDSQERPDATL